MAKTKVMEIPLRVRVPKGATVAQVRRAITDSWYGEIYTDYYIERAPVIKPRWGRARLVKED